MKYRAVISYKELPVFAKCFIALQVIFEIITWLYIVCFWRNVFPIRHDMPSIWRFNYNWGLLILSVILLLGLIIMVSRVVISKKRRYRFTIITVLSSIKLFVYMYTIWGLMMAATI